jgi:hypothetical protein
MGRTDREKGKGERLLVFETVLYTMPGVNRSVRCVACGLAASAKEERCQGGPRFSISLLALFCATCYVHLLSLCSVPLQLLLHTYLLLTPTGTLVITHGSPGLSARKSEHPRLVDPGEVLPLCEAGAEKKSSRQEIYDATKSTRRYLLNRLGSRASTSTCTSNSSPTFNTSGWV